MDIPSVLHAGQLGNKDLFKCINVIWEFEKLSVVFKWASVDFCLRGGHPEGPRHLPLYSTLLLLFIPFLLLLTVIIEACSRAVEMLTGWINHTCPVQLWIDNVQCNQWAKCTGYSQSLSWYSEAGGEETLTILKAVLMPWVTKDCLLQTAWA